MTRSSSGRRARDMPDDVFWDVRDRKRFAERCNAAMYLSIAAIPCLFAISWVVADALALAGICMAVTGLRGLRRVGPGPDPSTASGGAERLASRLARTAPRKARIALWCGGVVLVLFLAPVVLVIAHHLLR